MRQPQNSPQVEDGFTRIANELLEEILVGGFTQREQTVILVIIRKTYGYGKKTDDMSASQIAAMCNVPRQHVATTLVNLANRNVILKTPGKFGSVIGIQKNYKKWHREGDQVDPIASPESGQVASPKSVHPASPDLGQGCPESGQGRALGENGDFFGSQDQAIASEGAPELDSASPKTGHPSPESGHVPNRFKTSPKSGHTKETQKKEEKLMSGKSPDVIEILEHLNAKTGKRFQPVKANLKFIGDRLAESNLGECKAVIDAKVREWLHDPRMVSYLRPKTLFNATNFANYVGELGSSKVSRSPFA